MAYLFKFQKWHEHIISVNVCRKHYAYKKKYLKKEKRHNSVFLKTFFWDLESTFLVQTAKRLGHTCIPSIMTVDFNGVFRISLLKKSF